MALVKAKRELSAQLSYVNRLRLQRDLTNSHQKKMVEKELALIKQLEELERYKRLSSKVAIYNKSSKDHTSDVFLGTNLTTNDFNQSVFANENGLALPNILLSSLEVPKSYAYGPSLPTLLGT